MKPTQQCPGGGTRANTQTGPWRGTCPYCGKQTQVRIDGTYRRHGTTRDQLDAQARRRRDPAAALVVCPWCPHTIEDHDDAGCDHVIEVGGYEYICNCAQTPTEIRNYLRDKAS
jgi:hypothetical protein